MKKKLKIIIPAVILVLLIIGGSIGYSFLPHPLNYDIESIQSIVTDNLEVVSKTEDTVTVRNKGEEKIKVLFFTDIHLDGKNKTSKITVANIVNNIVKEKPDLVIFGGDTVTSGFNKKRCNQLAQIFENLGVYWAGCHGNHEGDNSTSLNRSEMIDVFSSYDHCLMLEGPEDIWGDGNYQLNILNSDNTLCESFFFLDTGDEVLPDTKAEYGIPDDEDPYDGVKTSQIKWYTDKVSSTKLAYGDFKSIMVIHIPLPQVEQQYESRQFLYGEKREGICESGFDSGLFEAIRIMGSTQAVFFGHDHLNDFGFEYEGILLSYLQPSGYGSYTAESKLGYEEKDWLQGYVKMEIDRNGSFAQERHRNSENMQ